eukprot:GHVR01083078.1.p1 GENE.GHVR01083078.1~~GHVR01083078.1.p1  ORF type:complete len:110 (+),score=9.53 GHVR01083078.1:356-685(+)
MQEPVVPLSILRVAPIGYMDMIDQGEKDEKIICVHLDDPEFMNIKHINDIPQHRLLEIRRFFEDYKKNENKEVSVDKFFGPDEAKEVIKNAIAKYDTEIRSKQKFLRMC